MLEVPKATQRYADQKIIIESQCSKSTSIFSSLGRYVFGSEISYNKAPPRLPGLGC
jgi:hypothetical protein